MNLSNTIIQLKSIGVSLAVVAGNIKVHIPDTTQQAHPEIDALLKELKAHKPEAIQILSQQKKAWVEPELKPVRALLLWSELLQGHFWWLIEKSALPEIQKDGIPIYDDEEIDIMLDAKNDEERRSLHLFKRKFNAKIHKST